MNDSRIKNIASFSVKAGGTLGAVAGFVGDFLTPISPFGTYVAAVAIILLTLAIVLWAIVPKTFVIAIHEKHGLDINESIWFGPLAVSLLLLAAISFASYKISTNYGDNHSGVIASLIPEVKQIQQSLGAIEKNSREMVEQQRVTNNKLDLSNKFQGEIAANSEKSVELQTLTNKGVFWNLQTLQDALVKGDMETLELFRQQGQRLSDVNLVSSPPMLEPMILYAMKQNHRNMDDVISYLNKHAAIKLNTLYESNLALIPGLGIKVQINADDGNTITNESIENGTSFRTYQHDMLAHGYEIPNSLENAYNNKDMRELYLGQGKPKITLLIYALYSGNTKAAKYLVEHADTKARGYIEFTNGVKYSLIPHAIASNSNDKDIRSLASKFI